MPPHRRRDIASGFDARQKVSQIDLEICFVFRRRHAVDARRAILARQTVGLEHPFEVDKMMQRSQRPLGLIPRQIGYPLSFRGQVRGTQSSLPCFSAMGLCARRPPFLERVPVSPVPRLPRYYEAATTSRGAYPSAYGFASGFRTRLAFRVRSRAPDRRQAVGQAWSVVQPALPKPAVSYGHARDLSGSLASHPAPLPCSKTPAEPVFLAMAAFPMLPPDPTRRRLQHFHDFEANHRALAPAVYASRTTLPPPMQELASFPVSRIRIFKVCERHASAENDNKYQSR